jgi:BirA family biotin operon repressor/biotin-[acetyl-CoA-carboxylase] ligase
MKHLHFDTIESTQTELERLIKEAKGEYLVTAQQQTAGRGRAGNTWDHYQNNLALSFNLAMANTPTLTPLEMGVHICEFFKDRNLKLKWPNDILNTEGFKCGGVIIQAKDQEAHIGIGLNLGKSSTFKNDYKIEAGTISESSLSSTDFKDIPRKIYEHIKNNRLSDEEIITKWNQLCAHADKEVEIFDTTFRDQGIFKKIGPNGEAYLDINGDIKKYFSGSLVIH